MHKLLVRGYIREQETKLIRRHIPSEITLLCTEYYYSNSKLMLLTNQASTPHLANIYITNLNDDEERKENVVWSSKLSALPISNFIQSSHSKGTSHSLLHRSQQFVTHNAGIASYSNIPLPLHVLSAANLTTHHNNNVIFQCGGEAASTPLDECVAIIFNDTDFVEVESKEHVMPYVWQLPSFQTARSQNTLLYSKWYGLLSIGGVKAGKPCDDIMQLPFDHDGVHHTSNTNESESDTHTKSEWKWRRLASLQHKLRDAAAVMINDRTLFVCGGMKTSNSNSKEVAIYDFEIGEWIPLRQSKYARDKIGLYFDKYDKRVYCIGGNESNFAINKCSYYDLELNEWFRLPNTSGKHGHFPVVWKHANNKNVLIVASYITNSMETYDLRAATALQYTRQFESGWWTIYARPDAYPKYAASLDQTFKIKFENYKLSKCSERLLKFQDDYF